MIHNTITHYWKWFVKIKKQYGVLTALMCFLYNGKNYNLDGTYR